MRIAMVASEAVPWAKTGGLGDVLGSLPRALPPHVQVSLFLPKYATPGIDSLTPIRVDEFRSVAGTQTFPVRILRHDVTARFQVFLVEQDVLFARRFLYGDMGCDYPDNFTRFLLFQRAVLDFLSRGDPGPVDVLHAHDWQAALLPLLLRRRYRKGPLGGTRTVFSIHNLGYQGLFPAARFAELDLPGWFFTPETLEFHGQLNFLKGGILYADAVTTVSPTYAREIQTQPFGFGLDGLLRAQRRKLTGILNGIDDEVWNPASDRFLDRTYTADTLSLKHVNKREFLRRMRLGWGLDRPLLAVISRLVPQKGIDLLLEALPALLHRQIGLVVLGKGDPAIEDGLARIAAAHPDQVAFYNRFDEELAHRIEAAADMFVMPSRYEPCGLNQMYSMAYGTVPVVHATGGLADTVGEAAPAGGSGTGFRFHEPTVKALSGAITRALSAFHQPAVWRTLQTNGMGRDFSWERAGNDYLSLYQTILSQPTGGIL